MSLNIKNPETHALAAQLATRLELSMTEAVTVALKDKLAATEPDVAVEQRLARLLKVANAIAERLTPEQKAFDVDAELYDERGLPK
jgi:antitoxin VapB